MLTSIIRSFSRLLTFISDWCFNLFASSRITCNLSQILTPNLILLVKGTDLRVYIIRLIKWCLRPIGFLWESWIGGCRRSISDIRRVSVLMMAVVGINCLLLSLVRPVLVKLHVLEHTLPMKLISCLGINIGINQHLGTWLLRSHCWLSRRLIAPEVCLTLHLSFT